MGGEGSSPPKIMTGGRSLTGVAAIEWLILYVPNKKILGIRPNRPHGEPGGEQAPDGDVLDADGTVDVSNTESRRVFASRSVRASHAPTHSVSTHSYRSELLRCTLPVRVTAMHAHET